MRLIYADYNPYTNSIDVNTFENYILRIAAFCGLSFSSCHKNNLQTE